MADLTQTIKTVTPELQELENDYKGVKNSPWDMYNNLTWNEVICTFNDEGFEVAKELIRRSDIRAYRQEEASCGCI
jgi:uncharacterized protein Smg (DUF494 family)